MDKLRDINKEKRNKSDKGNSRKNKLLFKL